MCQTSVDLVFVLDNSGSVGLENFVKVKDFVKSVIDFFNIGPDGTHVAVVTYDTETQIEFKLLEYFTKNELRNAVDDIEYNGFLTYTGEALNTVRQQVLTASNGMRTDAGEFCLDRSVIVTYVVGGAETFGGGCYNALENANYLDEGNQ